MIDDNGPEQTVPAEAPRQIRQIAVFGEGETYWPSVLALCSDGTLWMMRTHADGVWVELPRIPQSNVRE